ncbi:hypothetical protein VR5_103 [Escherichia phage vb_EcoM-VR5]|uniref:Uncharacterized protein n=1 Tax=Escherichia phage vb_EcoM-VR5 TaxID=1567026 RepID=A0A0A7HEJ9_9CAUD|nr:hypothetical protein AVV69_gp103 [Escherichia phage vb_EcoM-VR5]AIZ01890.1 hypothetical protein VR5_103 [Escherichia phage vb_EcoM-VR5]
MGLNSKILILAVAVAISYIVLLPIMDDTAYKREIEVVAATYNANNKECPNKNGMELIKAHYLLSITSPIQRGWVSENFNDVFYAYCSKLKKL